MAVDAAVGQLSIGTGAAGTTVAVSSLSFQPKAIIFWWSGSTSTVNAQSSTNVRWGVGFTAGSADNFANAIWINDNSINVGPGRYHNGANCIAVLASAVALDGLAALQSFDANGFTLVINDQFTASYTINYLALGGADLTNANVLQWSADTTAGAHTQAVTGLGFQPSCLLHMTIGSAGDPPAFQASAELLFGATTGPTTAENAINLQMMEDTGTGAANDCYRYNRVGDSLGVCNLTTGAFLDLGYVQSFDADGFTVNWTTKDANAFRFYTLGLAGVTASLFDFATLTNTTDMTGETGLGTDPSAVLYCSHGTSQSSAGTMQAHCQTIIGAAASPASRRAQSFVSEDGVTTSDCGFGYRDDAIYNRLDVTAAATLQGLVDLVEKTGNGGLLHIMDDADPDAAHVWAVAIGVAATAQTDAEKGMAAAQHGQRIAEGARFEAADVVAY